MNVTAWSNGLEVTGGGTGVVSHAGLGLVRRLADKTGLTGGLSRALWSGRVLGHDRGRVLADVACVIADGARAISDFKVLADQKEAFGQVASVPTAYRTLEEIAEGGDRTARKLTAAVNAARRYAWAQVVARHGKLPGVRVADKVLAGVTCIRLDATVTFAHSEKELAEGNFKGFGHYPLNAYCDNTGEPLAWMLRKGSAGSNTAADHITVTDAAIAALPPAYRRNLMVTVDGAGFSHKFLEHLDTLAARRGHTLTYSCGWELGEREKAALRLVPAGAWEIAIDHRGEIRERRADGACGGTGCGHRACWIEEAHVTELTGLLRTGPSGDQLAGWPATMRLFARRERPHPGAKLSLFEHEDGYRYQLWVTNLPETTKGWRGKNAYIDAAHRVHARVEDAIRTGKDTGIGRFPSHEFAINQAWLTAAMTAQVLLCWLKLIALDGDLARAEPKTLRYRVLNAAARLVRGGRRRRWKIAANWPWAQAITRAWQRITALPNPGLPARTCPCDLWRPSGACGTPRHRPASRNTVIPARQNSGPSARRASPQRQPAIRVNDQG